MFEIPSKRTSLSLPHTHFTTHQLSLSASESPFSPFAFGNPSSHSPYGSVARFSLSSSRAAVASLIHCSPDEITFTRWVGVVGGLWRVVGECKCRCVCGCVAVCVTALCLSFLLTHHYLFLPLSGGTESNHLAIEGYLRRFKGQGRHIICSSLEHPAVMEVFMHAHQHSGEFIVPFLSLSLSLIHLPTLNFSLSHIQPFSLSLSHTPSLISTHQSLLRAV